MELTVHIPDDIVSRLNADRAGLERRALEALALDEYRTGHITKPELRRMLGFGTRYKLDGFLKQHGVTEEYSWEDLERDRETLKRLGF